MYSINGVRRAVKCADGFTVSIQDSPRHYCNWLYSVDLGFPSEPMGDAFLEYAENRDEPCDTVYAHVPIELVRELLERHGGIVSGGDIAH